MDYLRRAQGVGRDVWLAGGVDSRQVAVLEHAIGAQLPASYREFLEMVGAMAIGDSCVSGIIDGDPVSLEGGSLYGDTIRSRGEQKLPRHLLVIQADDDAPHCLDLLSIMADGECAVVCHEVASGAETRIADSFNDWFSRFFLYAS